MPGESRPGIRNENRPALSPPRAVELASLLLFHQLPFPGLLPFQLMISLVRSREANPCVASLIVAALAIMASGFFPGPDLAGIQAETQEAKPIPSIADKTQGMEKRDGFIPLFWDSKAGKIWLQIDRFDEEMLYYVSLPAGMGQNDLGLNRGDLGPSMVVSFHRVGPKILMNEANYSYRAVSDDPLERKSVDDGFPTSVIWGFDVGAETGGSVLVDATSFFIRDAHGVINTLRQTQQGTFSLDTSRSAVYLPRTRNFPENTEVEFTLTFTADQPGNLVRTVTPSAGALTLQATPLLR